MLDWSRLGMEERGSCLNIFRTTNRGPDLRNLHELRGQTTCCASESKHVGSRCIRRTGVVLMLRLESSWHWRSVDHVLTYSRRQILGRISETFTNYEAKDVLRKSVDPCLNIFRTTNRGRISRNLHELRGKRLVAASESNTSVREPEWF
ncbi:uncharacterized protein G2W53_045107 [Senna tora]|uniref:Uncharacterized protein n=1 Tax=Senna tora TaxID=362788 RepID=A0A834VY17_9FABA|nr:uncharacterized protein G2W53_045107 [Senna tora]